MADRKPQGRVIAQNKKAYEFSGSRIGLLERLLKEA